MHLRKFRRLSFSACVGAIAVITAACGSSSTSGPAATVPSGLTVNSFDVNFTVMATLKDLHSAGSGLVGVILPDTTSSVRYVNFDAPYLKKAFEAAGFSDSEFKIDNAQGNDATELAQAQANVNVGKLIGQGFLDCVKAWNVSSPQVFTLNGGEDTDPNAIDFAKGYNQVVWGEAVPQETVGKSANGLTLVGDEVAPGWDNTKGQTIFQQKYTANNKINATIEANDGLANAVVTVLKQKGVGPNKIPTVGQDATLQGIENVLQGYQCGSVYKAVYLEAQAAVALATILRAGLEPPSALVNGTTAPASGKPGNTQPAVLLTPLWVDKSKVASTVIKDNFVDKSALCQAVTQKVCTDNGIT
ncbi:MAG: substrate-binding domain-containing protein [Chloroflexi bacterium]|nr:MAG: substrate-binding domain-containing protein [Chloroflexota bacterium]